jgi:Holliday junction resolvase RusA-like endonuclease
LYRINHLYGFCGFKKFLTKEGKDLRHRIRLICLEALNDIDISQFKDKKLSVVIEIREKWIAKNGKIARIDVSNKEKFLVDSVFDALGLDDKQIFDHRMIKIHHNEAESSIIKIDVCQTCN